ncbi:hypothetical protein BH18ACT9_BH18ACT9_04090 [soil metagenome]
MWEVASKTTDTFHGLCFALWQARPYGYWVARTNCIRSQTCMTWLRALVAVAGQVGAWGRVWHAPRNPARTQAETIGDICAAAGKPAVPVRTFPRSVLTVGGLAVPLLRELQETLYQFERPYVLDSSAISREMGLEPSPWDEVCRRTAEG